MLIAVLALTGCTHPYVIKLNNGTQITTASKPRLQEDTYHFKDARGEEHLVPAGRVREITPASMSKKENKPHAVKSGVPKKRKWYLLWLA